MILPAPTRFLHVLDNTEGRQDAKPWEVLTNNKESPFGEPGKDYNPLFKYKVTAIYTEEEVLKILDQSELEMGGRQLPPDLGGPASEPEGKSVLSTGPSIKAVSKPTPLEDKPAAKKSPAKKKPAAKKTPARKTSEGTSRSRRRADGP